MPEIRTGSQREESKGAWGKNTENDKKKGKFWFNGRFLAWKRTIKINQTNGNARKWNIKYEGLT